MNKRLILLVLLLIALLLGLYQAIETLKEVKPNQAKLERKQRHLATLQDLAPPPGLVDLLAQAKLPPPDKMRALTDVYLPGQSIQVKDGKPEAVSPEWELLKSTVVVKALPSEALSHFLQKVENQPSPWRLSAYTLQPADTGKLSGEITFRCLRSTL